MRIILASASPRRAEILKMAGLDFAVAPSGASENITAASPSGLVTRLAERKAHSVAAPQDTLVIAADTAVCIDGAVLGKPHDTTDAVRMLTLLSGREHEVYTGVCIILGGRAVSFCERTAVRFMRMTEEEIKAYAASGEPADKAGAYGIQGIGGKFIEGITGDFYNVMGFPLSAFYRKLRELDPAAHAELFGLQKAN